jgi:predicted NAD/FAD-dependent oxidoreductase
MIVVASLTAGGNKHNKVSSSYTKTHAHTHTRARIRLMHTRKKTTISSDNEAWTQMTAWKYIFCI